MSFHEVRLPEKYSRGAQGGVSWRTEITTTRNGHETRLQEWERPIGRWDISHNIRTRPEMDAVAAFFWARRGRKFAFRFRDWNDFQAVGAPIGQGDGAQTVFQLVKRYSDGTYWFDRSIYKPVDGTATIYVDGAPVAATVDAATGEVTLGAPAAAGLLITADFEFDVPVRFDTDQLGVIYDNVNQRSWTGIPIREVRRRSDGSF